MPPSLRTVLIGVDLTAPSLSGAEWTARRFAPNARVVLAHVLQPHPILEVVSPEDAAAKETALREEAAATLADLRERLSPDRVETVLLDGDPSTRLSELAAECGADLVALGAHREGSLGGLLGSVSSGLLGHANVPVLIAHGVPDGPPRRMLVAIDRSETSAAVLAWAGTLAATFDMTGQVVSAVQPPGIPVSTTLFSSEEEYRVARARMVERTRAWVREAADEAGLGAERFSASAAYGRPELEIAQAAEQIGADLVVLGTRGHTRGRAFLLGSVSRRVIEASTCPVLVVPPEGAR